MIKRILSLVFVAALLVVACAPGALAVGTANAATNTGRDVVIIIDRSGTMLRNDPNDIALMAARNLIDIFDRDTTSVAVIGFGYDTDGYNDGSDPFVPLNDSVAVANLKTWIRNLAVKDRLDDTHTDRALELAKQWIDQRRQIYDDHSFDIIVLSDGKIDVGDSEGAVRELGNGNRLSQDQRAPYIEASRQSANAVAENCATDGVGIYSIGIYNDDPSVLGSDMSTWAQKTGGEYLTTNNVNDVPSLMQTLKSKIEGTDVIAISDDFRFHIDPGLLEVTITVIPGVRPNELEIRKVDSNPYEVIVSDDVVSDEAYTVIRMKKPAEGDYQLVFMDGNTQHDCQVIINANRQFLLRLSVPQPASMLNQETMDGIRLIITKQGMAYYDPNQNQPILKVINLDDPSRAEQTLGFMSWDSAEQCYYASFTPQREGRYQLFATLAVDSDGFASESNKVDVFVGKARLKAAKDFGELRYEGYPLIVYNADRDPFYFYETIGQKPQFSQNAQNPIPPTVFWDIKSYFDNPDGVSIDYISADFKNPDDARYADLTYDPETDSLSIHLKEQTPAEGVEFILTAISGGQPSDPVSGTLIVSDNSQGVIVNQARLDEFTEEKKIKNNTIEVRAFLPQSESKDGTIIMEDLQYFFMDPNYFLDNETNTIYEGIEITAVEDPEHTADASTWGSTTPNPLLIARIVDNDHGGQDLMVWGLEEGETTLTIYAKGYDWSNEKIEITVHVVSLLKFILIIAAIALAAILILTLIIRAIIIANAPHFAKGSMMEIRYLTDEDGDEGSCMLFSFGRGPAKLTDLCTRAGVSTSGIRKKLENVKIMPRNSQASVELRYKMNGSKGTATLSNNSDYDLLIDKDRDRILRLTYRMEDEDY